jgi:hypothetical protein
MNILTERRIAASLLILCGMVFVVGGILYMGRAILKWTAAQSDTHLMWERGFMIAAAVINVMGFVALESLLRNAGDSIIARLALTAYLLATAVLLTAEGSFLNNHEWVYSQVVLYAVLAFLAQAAFGAALLRTGLVPAWLGWATILWNLSWLAFFTIIRPPDVYYPVLHHAAPLIIGIALLVKR